MGQIKAPPRPASDKTGACTITRVSGLPCLVGVKFTRYSLAPKTSHYSFPPSRPSGGKRRKGDKKDKVVCVEINM